MILRRSLFLSLASTLVLGAAEPVAAEEAVDLAEARERFDHGVELYAAGDYAAALAEFRQAHRIAPNFAVLYNIGQAQAQLRRYAEAVATFEQYLEEGGARLPAGRRREVERELTRLRRNVGRLVVRVSPPGAVGTVHVEGVEVGRIPSESPIPVSAGRCRIEIRAEGYLTVQREEDVAGGAEVVIEATLTPAGPPGGILVSVSVPYATVLVDGREVGSSPLAEPVSAAEGHHVVEVRRPGYEPVTAEVDVEEGEVARVDAQLEPLAELPEELAGRLDVEVNEPAGVRFLLDGSPMPEGVVPIGPHRLEVRLEGFEPWTGEVVVERGEPTRVEVDLTPTEGFRERYEARASGIRLASYIVAGVGVAALGTALGVYLWNDDRHGDWALEDQELKRIYALDEDDPTRPADDVVRARQDDNDALWNSISTVDIVTWIVLGVGVAAAATWAGLFFGGPDPGRYSRVAVLPTPGGLTLAWSWP